MSRGELVELEPNPFWVTIDFGPTAFEAAHPEEMTEGQCERLLMIAMRIVQVCGHDPHAILDRMGATGKEAERPPPS